MRGHSIFVRNIENGIIFYIICIFLYILHNSKQIIGYSYLNVIPCDDKLCMRMEQNFIIPKSW